MPPSRALALLLLLAPAGLGCSVHRYSRLLCIQEPKLYCEPGDDRASLATYRSLADQAWATHGAACPEDCLAGDYAWGFREGFAQYVYAGGTGEPPAVPPRPYWQLDLRSPEGASAVRSWFEGYRHGSRIAREGGYRKAATITVSASLEDCDACGCPDRGERSCPATRAEQLPPTIGPELAPSSPELVVPPQLVPVAPLALPPAPAETNSPNEISREPVPPLPVPVEISDLGSTSQFEARTISVEGGTSTAQTAIFQIVR